MCASRDLATFPCSSRFVLLPPSVLEFMAAALLRFEATTTTRLPSARFMT